MSERRSTRWLPQTSRHALEACVESHAFDEVQRTFNVTVPEGAKWHHLQGNQYKGPVISEELVQQGSMDEDATGALNDSLARTHHC